MDKTKTELLKENITTKHRNRELETLLGIRKQKSFCLRCRCSIRAFFKEFYRV